MRLQGKTALITGATSGIGFATAELFVREGTQVAITGRDAARLAQVRAQLGSAVTSIQADVKVRADLQRMALQVGDTFGTDGLDIFFGNAGVRRNRHF